MLHEVIPAGSHYRVVGAAWSGETDVNRVELSTDGGRAWQPARFRSPCALRLAFVGI